MVERDYRHRDVIDKLAIKAGQAVAVDGENYPLPDDLIEKVKTRIARPLAADTEPLDVVLVALTDVSDPVAKLSEWRARLKPTGGVWLLSPKRGRRGYVDQRVFIDAGPLAGLVDNKVCSVNDVISAMRFVIRRRDR